MILFLVFLVIFIFPIFSVIVGNISHPTELLLSLKNIELNQILLFSLFQALASSAISVGIGLIFCFTVNPQKRLLDRVLLKISSVPFYIPSISVCFLFIDVFGNNSLVTSLFQAMEWKLPENFFLYSGSSIVLAHIFMNSSYCLLKFYEKRQSIPKEYYLKSKSLNLSTIQTLKYVEWDQLKTEVLNTWLTVFILCLTAFSTVFILGGGQPQYKTVEVSIYEALKFEGNFKLSTSLLILQTIICFFLAILQRKMKNKKVMVSMRSSPPPLFSHWIFKCSVACLTGILLYFLCHLVFVPLAQYRVSFQLFQDKGFWQSVLYSTAIACLSAFSTVLLSTYILSQKKLHKFSDYITFLLLSISPMSLAFSWQALLIDHNLESTATAPVILTLLHTLYFTPFALQYLSPAISSFHDTFSLPRRHLALGYFQFLRVASQTLKGTYLTCFVFMFAFSIGESSAAFMLQSGSFTPLSVYLYELMGRYRFQEASVAALSICVIPWLALIFSERRGLK